jgi:Protein of unknown function (DUF3048) N-terminal domain/Protein of unknown function (DUF3048) C-terminal domain
MARGPRRSEVVVVLLTTVALAVIVALAMTGTEPVSVPPGDIPGTTPTPTRAPLTGLVVDDVAALDHPAVAIKVSDVRQAHPQTGIERADIVFVEPIGVSYTRLAAVFHSDVPESVGPVRSIRPPDAPLLGPLAPVFGNTMGAQWVVDYVDATANVDDLGTLRVSGSGAYVQDPARPRPDDVFAKPLVLLDLSDFTAPPEPYFSYASDTEPSSAERAGGPGTSAEVPYGPGWSVTWTYDDTAGRYLRQQPWGPHVTTQGTQVGAVNVLILDVASETRRIGEGSGAPVPVLELIDASGQFVALAGGRSVSGTWSKAGANEPFRLRTDDGGDLLLAPGNTWVELAAPSADVTVR